MTDKLYTYGNVLPKKLPLTYEKYRAHDIASLRDQFAMAAMQGDLASQSVSLGHFANDASEESLVNRANFYYRMADAMLKARG